MNCKLEQKNSITRLPQLKLLILLRSSQLNSVWGTLIGMIFFAITSSLFALHEGTAVFEEHQHFEKNDLLNKFYEIEQRIGVITKLNGISAIQTVGRFAKGTSYALIVLDTVENKTHITEYSEKDILNAYSAYANIEQKILSENNGQIALLASADEFKKLKEGYLAYFLDVQEFIKELENLRNQFTSLQSS